MLHKFLKWSNATTQHKSRSAFQIDLCFFFFLTECWYLVTCEDDCNLRVLHEDEVQHIFPEDNEEELLVGDVVNALWLPNDQYYDAKVLQKGGKQRFSLFLIIEIFPDKLIQPLIKRRVPPTVLIKH